VIKKRTNETDSKCEIRATVGLVTGYAWRVPERDGTAKGVRPLADGVRYLLIAMSYEDHVSHGQLPGKGRHLDKHLRDAENHA